MKVCAFNLDNKQEYCTQSHLRDEKYTYGFGYQLELPVGDYYVYATVPEMKNYKAYYSDFIACGLTVKCKSHKPITVLVESLKMQSGVDPIDWYKE